MHEDARPREALRLAERPHRGHLHAPITHHEIFREMIAYELRAGRLTRARRQRIVRYAAQLGLSAVEAGRMIEACRQAALESDDPLVREHALRLVEPPQAWSFRAKLGITMLGAILVHLILRAVM